MPEGKKRLTAKDLLSLKIASDPRLSPDGKAVVFVVAEADLERSQMRSHLWLVPTDGGAARQLTRGKASETLPRWSPDGKWIAFLSDRPAAGGAGVKPAAVGEEKPKQQVWLLPGDGGEPFALICAEEGVTTYDWSPDGKEIFFIAQEALSPERKVQREADKKAKRDGVVEEKERFHKEIWRVDVGKKKATRVWEGDFGVGELQVAPDGARLAYTTNYTGRADDYDKSDVWILNLADGGARHKLCERSGGNYAPRWSPDGCFVAFAAGRDPEVPYSQRRVFIAPAVAGDAREALGDYDRGVEQCAWGSDGSYLVCALAAGTTSQLCSVAWETRRVYELTQADRTIRGFHLSSDGAQAALILEDGASPTEVYLLSSPLTPLRRGEQEGGESELRQLTTLNAHLSEFELGAVETVHYQSADGLEIEGILTKPVGCEGGEPYPLLVLVHGGPHGRVTQSFAPTHYAAQFYAAHGYAVFAPNFRGSSGYGRDFDVANRRDLGGKDFEDVMSGVDALIRRGVADPDRLGIFGGSYGGYMTNWAIARSDRFKAAVSIYGIFNLITDFSNSVLPSWEHNYFDAYYWEDLKPYLERSPFSYVKRIQTPVLILHGEADNNTFISNSKEMWQALTHLKKTCEFVHYPREGHGFREPNHVLDAMQRTLVWFDRWLKGDAFASVALHELGEGVEANGWEMTATGVWFGVQYPAQRANGHFVQVDLHFAPKGKGAAFSLNLPTDAALLTHDGKEIPPKGVPFWRGEHCVLLGGQPSIALDPDDAHDASFSLTLVFDAPPEETAFALRVKDFPLVRMEARADV